LIEKYKAKRDAGWRAKRKEIKSIVGKSGANQDGEK